MPTTPPGPSQAPLRQPPVLSLINASRTLNDDVRWDGGGVEFQSLPCSTSSDPIPTDCDTADLTPLDNQDARRWEPVGLWAGVQCSPFSWDVPEGARRARELLNIDQHRQLEREFWTGTLADAENLPNLWLAMDGEVDELEGGTATPLTAALTTLQQELATCGGGRGMIHSTVRTAGLWSSLGLLRRSGNLLLDVFDNIVVPGVGYDGSGPGGTLDTSGDTAWAYATGIVDTRLGPLFVPEDPAAIFVRNANTIEVRAQRQALAYWDGCCHLGINVDHATSGVTGAGGGGGGVDGGSP